MKFSIEPRGTTGIVLTTETEAERDDLLRRITEHFPPTGGFQVVDLVTDTVVREWPTEANAIAQCRDLNVRAGPGGRYDVRGPDGERRP